MAEADNDVLFGQLAVKRGLISSEELDEALALQKRLATSGAGKPVGELLVELGYLTRKQSHRLLQEQQVKTGATKTIGHFEVLAKLGEGGMGAVYLAKMIGPPIRGGSISGGPEETVEGPLVALKILPPRLARDELLLLRFQREVEALAGLQHPNIVRAVDWGKADGLHFLAMQFVQGENAYQKVSRDGPMPEKQVAEIAISIARALEYAAEHGVVHRDIKPENILVDLSGVSHLTDFGLVSLEGSAKDDSLVRTGVTVGTPYYISPEQARGEDNADARSDLYSLGATMFHLLTNQAPYDGEDSAIIMTKHIVEPVPDPSERNRRVSPEISAIVMKLMAKSPSERYQSPHELVEDLKQLLQGNKPAHARLYKSRPVPVPKRLSSTRARMAAAQAPWQASRQFALTLGLAAIGLVSTGLLMGLLLSRRPHGASVGVPGDTGVGRYSAAATERVPAAAVFTPAETSPLPAAFSSPEAAGGVELLLFESTPLITRTGATLLEHAGRRALLLPRHRGTKNASFQLLLVDATNGIIPKADPAASVRICYKSTGPDNVKVELAGKIDGRLILHPAYRQPLDNTGRWLYFELPLATVGVTPGEFVHDLTVFFECSTAEVEGEVYVSEVRLLPAGRDDLILADIRADDVTPGADWEVRGRGLYTHRHGAELELSYSLPRVAAALVVVLWGNGGSSAEINGPGFHYNLAIAAGSEGQVFRLPFHGPKAGRLRLRMFPLEGGEIALHRVLFYRMP